jgi:predicted DNA-binding ribbon-helix-helix protein
MARTVQQRSIKIDGHATSITLENSFWEALREIAAMRRTTVYRLVEQINSNRTGNLSSGIREFVLREYLDYYKRQQVGREEEVA